MGEVPVDLQEESPKSADCSKSDLLKRMVGKSNDTEIFIAGVKTVGLIDSGSQITSVSESFYQSLEPKPTLHDVKELGLSVTSAGGSQLPVKGYIEVDVSLPFISDFVIPVPVLVVNNTDFNSQVPAIIGTNVIKLCKSFSSGSETDIPEQWKLAFDSLVDETIPVKLPIILVFVLHQVRSRHCLVLCESTIEILTLLLQSTLIPLCQGT